MLTLLKNASLALLVAAGVSLAVADETAQRERYMVVLKEGIAPHDVPSIVERFERNYAVRTVTTFTQGAQAGVLVEASPAQAPRLRGDVAVAALLKVGDLKSARQDIPADKLYKLPTGWAIPGSYEVHLFGGASGFEADRSQRVPAWKDPNWQERDAMLIKAVKDVAESLIAQHGGRMTFTGAPSDASFTCAMNEAQARSMLSDPRVRFVAESAYMIQQW